MKKYQILQCAKQYISNHQESYVCHAVAKVGKRFSFRPDILLKVDELIQYIDQEIQGYGVVTIFVKETDRELFDHLWHTRGWLQYRLDWMDRMIAHWKNMEGTDHEEA